MKKVKILFYIIFILVNNNSQMRGIQNRISSNSFLSLPLNSNSINKSNINNNENEFNNSIENYSNRKFYNFKNEKKKFKPFTGRNGDWICSNCQNLNFAFRIICNRCHIEKIESEKNKIYFENNKREFNNFVINKNEIYQKD